MSASRVSEDDPDNGNKPHSDTTENTLQLSKKRISALDVGGQQPKGFNVFVLSPNKLKDIGLVVKMNNGRPIIMHENKDGSTGKVVSTSQLVPLLQTQKINLETVVPDRMNATDSGLHEEAAGISAKSQSQSMSTGLKRKRLEENDANMQKGLYKQLKSDSASEDWSTGSSSGKDEAAMSVATVPNSAEWWHSETRRHLHRFSVHWQLALAEIGHINCPMRECNYISLSEDDMVRHYLFCDGKPSVAAHACPICMHRLSTEDDLKAHMHRSHPSDGFQRKTLQQIMEKNEWQEQPKVKLLLKRRSFSKVHKVSWNIAIESKGYVKCLFQNCSYLALTVDEMIKHYGICNGGGDVGAYRCPYKCAHCGGAVETEEKLQAHIERSHSTEQSSYDIKLLSASSSTNYDTESVVPSLELMKPAKLKSQVDKESSHLQDSFIITLNASDGNESDDKDIQLVSVDNIKVEAGETLGYSSGDRVQNVHDSNSGQSHLYSTSCPVTRAKSCPVNKKLLMEQVLPHVEEVSNAWEERNVSEVEEIKEKCNNRENADKIVTECVAESMDYGTVAAEEKPDVCVPFIEPGLCSALCEVDMDCSGRDSGVNICSTENPPFCIVSKMDLNQHVYSKSHLSSSVPSTSKQSNDIDVRTDIHEDDTYSSVYHRKQYSSIYSDESYGGGFCEQPNTETDSDTSAKWLDTCRNVEQQSTEGDSGPGKCRILKTYSRRRLRLHSNAFSSPVQPSKSFIEVADMKKETPDTTARELNNKCNPEVCRQRSTTETS
ncbi:hypothetical protein B7P43_G12400, partial [Cryptotermes secundus]